MYEVGRLASVMEIIFAAAPLSPHGHTNPHTFDAVSSRQSPAKPAYLLRPCGKTSM